MADAMTAAQLDMFAGTAPIKRKGKWCGRDVDAGIGTCHAWWDLCPERVQGCYVREIQAMADRHRVRYRDPIPPAMQAEIEVMHARRRAERGQP